MFVVSGAVVACAAAFVVGTQVRSPWEQARQNANATVVASAVVVDGEIVPEAVTLEGTVTTGAVEAVVFDADGGDVKPVVTRQRVSPGDVVGSGTALADIADRPVIAWELPFPLYRDLFAGDTGSDVLAVQHTLRSLGFDPGSADGVFGAKTQAALASLYSSIGASAPSPAPEDLAAVEDARSALQTALTPGEGAGVDEAAVATAREALSTAEARVAGWLPSREVVAVAGQSIVASAAPVGAVLSDGAAVVELRSGPSVAVGRASLSTSDSFTVGADVTVGGPGVAAPVGGVVTAVSDFLEASDDQPPGYEITIALATDGGVTEGGQVTVSLDSAQVALAGTVIPLSAIRSEGSDLRVLVLDSDPSEVPARTHPVDVELLASRDGVGLVEGDVGAGQRVVVG